MAQPTRDDVLAALAAVIDPASGKSVTATGMIQGLVHQGQPCRLLRSKCRQRAGAAAEPLRKACEDAVARAARRDSR